METKAAETATAGSTSVFIFQQLDSVPLSKSTERVEPKIRERIALHIYRSLKRNGGKAVTAVLSQHGIADALNITRPHAAIELERGSEKGIFYSQKAKTKNNRREINVYLLTSAGVELAKKLDEQQLSAEIVEDAIARPSRHAADRVLGELGDREIALLCALRIHGPLEMKYLPQQSRIPYVIRNGNRLEASEYAEPAIDRLIADADKRKLACSLLSDYLLRAGEHPMRLKYLVESGRIAEAARLVDYHWDELQSLAVEDIADALLVLENSLSEPGDPLLMLTARAMLQLRRQEDAISMLSRLKSSTPEIRLISRLADVEYSGRTPKKTEIEEFREHVKTDREKSLYHRLCAMSYFMEGDIVSAERETARAVRTSSKAGDVSELKLNYALLARVERAGGDFTEAARVESKLKGVDRLHVKGSD